MTEETTQDVPAVDPCTVPHDWSLIQRLNWVRSHVGYLKKAKDAGGYLAITHDEVTGYLRKHLVAAGVFIVPTLTKNETVDSGSRTSRGVIIIRMETEWTVTFTCGRGDDISMVVPSHGLDYGDKAPGKAMSYAVKYAMLKLFNIETGEDDESRIEQKAAEEIEREKEEMRRERLSANIAKHMDSIVAIKTGIREGDLSAAAEAWYELTQDEQKSIWAAPSKGGPFTTDEQKIMKSRDFRVAHYGEAHVIAEEEVKQKAKEAR